jgi:hypothetical protein
LPPPGDPFFPSSSPSNGGTLFLVNIVCTRTGLIPLNSFGRIPDYIEGVPQIFPPLHHLTSGETFGKSSDS